MGERDHVHSLGLWAVKPGREGDFILAWETFARWTSEHQPGMEGEARLLEDIDEPRRFVSIGEWSNMKKADAWRESAEFRDFFGKVSELCEQVEHRMLRPVVLVSPKKK